jgi:hypothetical protein
VKRAALLVLVLLSGCDTFVRRVEVPVPVPCRVQLPEHPVWATDALPADAGLFEQVRALLAERAQRQAYELKLEAAAKACA